jgi:hypothetical protein
MRFMQEYSSDAFSRPWSAFPSQAEGNLSIFLLNAPRGFKTLFVKDAFLEQPFFASRQGQGGRKPPGRAWP